MLFSFLKPRVLPSVIALTFFFFSPLNLSANEDIARNAKSISHYIMGLMQDWIGSPQEALDEYQKAAQVDSDNYAIHLRLGIDYARLGKLDEAVSELKIALADKPGDVETRYLLAFIYSTQQKFDEAAKEYETILVEMIKMDPKNTEVRGYLGQLYYSQKNYDKAIEQYQFILNEEPKNAEIIFLLGSIYLDKGDHPKAVALLKQAINIDPEHHNSLNSLGYLYAEDDTNLDEALGLVQKALELDPDNGAYLDSLGWVYYKKEMYPQAIEFLTKAIDAIKDPVIYEHLGDVYHKMNQNADAEKYWRQSLDLLPEQENILKKLAVIGIKIEKNKISSAPAPSAPAP